MDESSRVVNQPMKGRTSSRLHHKSRLPVPELSFEELWTLKLKRTHELIYRGSHVKFVMASSVKVSCVLIIINLEYLLFRPNGRITTIKNSGEKSS